MKVIERRQRWKQNQSILIGIVQLLPSLLDDNKTILSNQKLLFYRQNVEKVVRKKQIEARRKFAQKVSKAGTALNEKPKTPTFSNLSGNNLLFNFHTYLRIKQ